MAETNVRIEHPNDDDDFQKAIGLLRRLQNLRRYSAIVVKTINPQVLQVNVPSLNLKNVRCYITHYLGETYQNNAEIIVNVDESGICFSLPKELPRGPGKTKVVQAIDDSDPATLGLDWLRFNDSAFNPFDDESND
jgi:hypothetical protein